MKRQYTSDDMAALLAEVEKTFTAELAKAEAESATLAKSEDKEPKDKSKKEEPRKDEPKKEKEEEAHAEAHESKEATEGKEESEEKHAEAEGDKREAKEDHKESEDAKHENAPRHDEGDCDYDEHDMEHMHKMYMSMSKGELKAHHDSCRMALDKCGMAKCGDMQMAKSEKDAIVITDTKTGVELELLKSEHEATKAKYEELKKSMELATELLTKLAKKSVPQAKAITSLEPIMKNDNTKEVKDLSPGEVKSILSKRVAEDKTLTKSDRDAINSYWLGEASINKISHLLNKTVQ